MRGPGRSDRIFERRGRIFERRGGNLVPGVAGGAVEEPAGGDEGLGASAPAGGHLGRADGTLDGADGEHPHQRADDAPGGGDLGEESDGGGLGEQGLQLAGTAAGLVAEDADEPETAAGEHARMRAAGAGRAGLAGLAQLPRYEAGHQALEAAGEAVDTVPQRDDDRGETRVAPEPVADDGGQRGHDEGEPTGEVGRVELELGEWGYLCHEKGSNT